MPAWTRGQPMNLADDQLVATGNPIVDTFLKIARAMLVPQEALENAEAGLNQAQRDDTRHGEFNGTAERRQRAEQAHDEANRQALAALRVEEQARAVARAADPRLYALADVEVKRTWKAFYARKHGSAPATRYSAEWQAGGAADDPARWEELEPGAEIRLTYETTGQTVVWRFAGLGEPHPGNPGLRIARYSEHNSC
ncbi:hypothetical protein [Nonomuraea wenchangensis]|uniref:hypothetical protein n=1 Tax=Nonomuraea wenchangensis TaxID=568860 RepID=UPI0033F3E1FD